MKDHAKRKIKKTLGQITGTKYFRRTKQYPRPGHLLLEDREGAPNFSDGDDPVVPAGGLCTEGFRV